MIKIGNNDTKLYLGNNEIEKVYLGSTKIYPSSSTSSSGNVGGGDDFGGNGSDYDSPD